MYDFTPPRLSRRSLLQASAGLSGAALLSACGGSTKKAADTVAFMNWEAPSGTPLGRALTSFEQQSATKVAVQPTVVGDAYETKMRTLLAGGNPPDVMRINDDFVRAYSDQGALLDLKPYIKRDKLDTGQFAKEAFEFGVQPSGEHTAWVIGYQPTMVFYNADMFAEAKLPLPPREWSAEGWTWEDFLAYAERLTDGERRWGALVSGYTGYEQTFSVNHGSSSGIYSPDGKRFTLADPEGAEAVQWVADLTCKKRVQPPPGELQQDNAALQMFAQGKIGMMFQPSGALPYLQRTIRDFSWDIAAPPGDAQQRTEVSVVTLTIPKGAPRPDEAWELLKYLASEEGGRIVSEDGAYLPIHRKAVRTRAEGKASPRNVHLFAEAADHLTAPNQTANTPAAREIYRPALDAVFSCERKAQDVLQEVRPRVEAALQRGA